MLHNMLRAAAGRDRIPTDGLVAYYTMEAISGGVLSDESGNGNDISISGAVQGSGPDGSSSLFFDGVDDYGELVSPAGFNVAEYTIIARINLSSSNDFLSIFMRDSGFSDGNRQWQFRVDKDTRTLRGIVFNSSNSNQQVVSNTALALDTDYDAAMVVSGTEIKLYINKVLDVSASLTLSPNTTSNYKIYLGTQSEGSLGGRFSFFHGYNYRTLFYNHAKTGAEIADI